MFRSTRIVSLLLFVLLSCAGAFAQFEAGSVQGVVQDTTGAVIPNASVELPALVRRSMQETFESRFMLMAWISTIRCLSESPSAKRMTI